MLENIHLLYSVWEAFQVFFLVWVVCALCNCVMAVLRTIQQNLTPVLIARPIVQLNVVNDLTTNHLD